MIEVRDDSNYVIYEDYSDLIERNSLATEELILLSFIDRILLVILESLAGVLSSFNNTKLSHANFGSQVSGYLLLFQCLEHPSHCLASELVI